jgi:regulator of sigma E protease
VSVLGVVVAVFAVGMLIVVHELGHFLAAKRLGVRVERFSVGFGPVLARWRRGGTEYVLSAIVLGGYVKMAGDEPGEGMSGAPDEFFSQSPGRRALIIVAGVAMNALLGFLCFIVAFQIGVKFPRAEVGAVVPGGPAEEAGLQPGDEIVTVGGWHDVDMQDVLQLIALCDPKLGLPLVISRDGAEQRVQLFPRYSPGLGTPTAGFDPAMSLTIRAVVSGFPAEASGLRPGDRVVSADGETLRSWNDLFDTVQRSGGRELRLAVDRKGAMLTFPVTPRATYGYRLGASPADSPATIGAVLVLSPAERGGLAAGDRVLEVGGQPVEGWSELARALAGAEAGPVSVVVHRKGNWQTLTVVVPADRTRWYNRIGILGQPPVVGEVEAGGPAAQAGLLPGMKVTHSGTSPQSLQPVTFWEELEVEATALNGQPLALSCAAEGKDVLLTLTPEQGEPTGRCLIGIQPEEKFLVRKAGFLGACRLGWSKSLLTAVSVYQSFRRILFTHTVSSSQLAGPLTIGYITYKTASAGLSRLLYLLGIIGINLSLVNLLPIPILDGGHLMVIAVEKIKGSPVSPRALALAQYVGLALLVSLFLFLTYNDITVHLKLLLGG